MRRSHRLPEGGRIDRSAPLKFRFNGQAYTGFVGDTLASALLANGVRMMGRSFKLHRPRGLVAMGSEEPNVLVQLGSGATTVPNLRATEIELFDELEASSVRGWPSLRFDLGGLLDVFGRFFSAGFYYKTFKSPRWLWHTYERMIRASAGWGFAPTEADPDQYEHHNVHCDVLVAGAGPAGLMAALAAARAGARVILADEQSELGGRLLGSPESIDGQPANDWLQKTVAELAGFANVRLLPRSTVFGYYDHNFLAIAERCGDHTGKVAAGQVRQRLWRVRARQVVLAQGAIERPLVFCNNDRPGVMLASAVSTCIRRYAVRPGQKAVVFTNNDSAYQAALDLHDAGAAVVAVVDCRPGGAGEIGSAVEQRGIPILKGSIVIDVRGRAQVKGVSIASWNGNAAAEVKVERQLGCDLLAMSGGWNPAVHLHSQSGGKISWDEQKHCFLPAESVQACTSAGAGNGTWDLTACMHEGLQAGLAAAGACGFKGESLELHSPRASSLNVNPTQALWRVPAARDADRCPKQFIDFQNDTSVADVHLALREGYLNIEHVKRYTALGFGTDQGKLGNINGMAIVAEKLGISVGQVGTTTFRPAYTPVSFGVCAGESVGLLFDPVRKTSIHQWHESAGAVFEVVGQWLRPRYFPLADEGLDAAVARECLATRSSLGILDASTLGKIRVQGPDAVCFLNRLYTHDVDKMRVGSCAYVILLGEDGMLKDDGVMARLGEQEFYLTTTTGGAAKVLAWLESWLQTEWPELKVWLTSLTDHFSTIALAGPNSRRLLQQLDCSIPLDGEQFPFMSVRNGRLAGLPVQLFRISFSGEMAFEINIDSRLALQLWQTLMSAGAAFSITPYGTETMHVLRAEKGYFMVGQDTDGSVNPLDLNLRWMLAKNKDFLGKRSLARPDSVRPDRKHWVGLESVDGVSVVPEGSQLVVGPALPVPVPMCGHVTSSYWSTCLDKPIALALLAAGHARMGETLQAVAASGKQIAVKVVPPQFYDATGQRQND
jgi:sarcosine oxidase subunit alpha